MSSSLPLGPRAFTGISSLASPEHSDKSHFLKTLQYISGYDGSYTSLELYFQPT